MELPFVATRGRLGGSIALEYLREFGYWRWLCLVQRQHTRVCDARISAEI